MGYYTSHKLRACMERNGTLSQVELVDLELEKTLRQENKEQIWDDLSYAVDDNGDPCDSVKWYDHDDHMIAISKLYPDVIFLLEGHGEESGDIWLTAYHYGKKITKSADPEIRFEVNELEGLLYGQAKKWGMLRSKTDEGFVIQQFYALEKPYGFNMATFYLEDYTFVEMNTPTAMTILHQFKLDAGQPFGKVNPTLGDPSYMAEAAYWMTK